MTFSPFWQEKSQFLPRGICARLPIENIPSVLAIENSWLGIVHVVVPPGTAV